MIALDTINFKKLNGLVPAVIQDEESGQVLMVGFMNRESLQKTIDEKKVTFFSRSRQKLWQKGETSGNYLEPGSIMRDCDGDALLIKAKPSGAVCHTGTVSCFGGEKKREYADTLRELERIIISRKRTMPPDSYTALLFSRGVSYIAQKVGEEAVETIIAAMTRSEKQLREESADLIYHLMLLFISSNITLNDILNELDNRMRSLPGVPQ